MPALRHRLVGALHVRGPGVPRHSQPYSRGFRNAHSGSLGALGARALRSGPRCKASGAKCVALVGSLAPQLTRQLESL